jgi:hypothetical protein
MEQDLVTRFVDPKPHSFKGVSFELLANAERAMVTTMLNAAENHGHVHQRPHELTPPREDYL